MIVVTLMSGTYGEMAHIVYEGKAAIEVMLLIMDFMVCMNSCILQFFC